MICPVCQSNSYDKLYLIRGYEIVRCKKCSLVRLNHGLTAKQIYNLYQQNYFARGKENVGYLDYVSMGPSLRATFKQRLARIRKAGQKQTILDVGAGAGFFVEICKKAGFEADGIEVSSEAVEYAQKKLGIKLHKTSLEDFKTKKKYDIITAWDVLEHIKEPDVFLAKIKRLLKPKGKFYLSTGDISSAMAKISGKKWHLFNLPEHLFFFSPKTISLLLARGAFTVDKIFYPSSVYNLGYLLERATRPLLADELWAAKMINRISKARHLRNILIPLNLFDIMEVEAHLSSSKR